MKKIYLSLLFSGCALITLAQGQLTQSKQQPADIEGRASLHSTQIKSGGGFTEWYNYGSEIYDFGGNVNYFRFNLWPDSTVIVNFSNGVGAPWKHSVGQIFDPLSVFYETIHPQFSGAYSVDSIAIPYRYYRFQNGAPDTVRVHVVRHENITYVDSSGWSSGASYARVEYDYMKNEPLSPDTVITVLLTESDTSTAVQNFIQLPLGMVMQDGEKIAVTFAYFPGNPYNFGDTIDPNFTPVPANRRNAFVAYTFQDEDHTVDYDVYNHSLVATTDCRYNIGTNGWNGRYIPGTAWFDGFDSMDMYFLVSNPPKVIGVEEATADLDVQVYPNPSNGALNVTLPTIKGNAQYSIINALGQTVMTGNMASGNNQLDITHLEAGFYSLTLLVDGKLHSQKISKF